MNYGSTTGNVLGATTTVVGATAMVAKANGLANTGVGSYIKIVAYVSYGLLLIVIASFIAKKAVK